MGHVLKCQVNKQQCINKNIYCISMYQIHFEIGVQGCEFKFCTQIWAFKKAVQTRFYGKGFFLSNLINFLLDNKYLICTIIEKTNKFVIKNHACVIFVFLRYELHKRIGYFDLHFQPPNQLLNGFQSVRPVQGLGLHIYKRTLERAKTD